MKRRISIHSDGTKSTNRKRAPRFIQISGVVPNVCALDRMGRVWVWRAPRTEEVGMEWAWALLGNGRDHQHCVPLGAAMTTPGSN